MLRVLAIDPGVNHVGVVLIDEYGVSCAMTLAFKGAVKGNYLAVAERCREIAAAITPLLVEWKHDVTVMESWTYMASRSNASSIWETPYTIGYLQHLIEEADGKPCVLQSSPEVLRQTGSKADRKHWVKRIPFWQKLTNEHTISAAIHGWHYIEKATRPRLF